MAGPRETLGAGVLALALLAVLPAISASVRAEDVDAATKAAIQGVVQKQLEAFEHGDAAAAESFAAPGIRQMFPEPSKFLEMVKDHYGALIHPKSTQFTGIETSPHGPLQRMTVIAADGSVWSAIYSFEKVGDDWRITGCGLQEDKNQQAI